MAFEVGDFAPDFELKSTSESMFKLSEEVKKGPILLNFYIADFGINCTTYMTSFSENYEKLSKYVKMVGINNDGFESHKMFKQRMKLQWDLLFDENKKVANEYGSIVEPGHRVSGFTNREFYLIDKDLKIIYKWRSEIPKQLPVFDEIFEGVVKALQ